MYVLRQMVLQKFIVEETQMNTAGFYNSILKVGYICMCMSNIYMAYTMYILLMLILYYIS